jgi:hypothetical protein
MTHVIWHMYPPPHMTHASSSSYDTCHMTHVSSSSYDTCILLLIWHMHPPPHMTHVSSSSYDTCILPLIWYSLSVKKEEKLQEKCKKNTLVGVQGIWHMYPPPHMTHVSSSSEKHTCRRTGHEKRCRGVFLKNNNKKKIIKTPLSAYRARDALSKRVFDEKVYKDSSKDSSKNRSQDTPVYSL